MSPAQGGRGAGNALPFCLAALLLAGPARADVPLSYLEGFGARADPVVSLTWGLIAISVVVSVLISGLVLAGVWVRRVRGEAGNLPPVQRGGNGMPWLYWGVGLTTVVLLGTTVWTVVVLAAVNGPATQPAVTIEVTGQQWWWKVRYLSDKPSEVFVTADEIHIPVGQPVRIKLIGADVIHSFWVPALSGKTDAIPGQTNETWLQASRAGRYRGQCTEYCGQQHAHMGFVVVAEPPETFEAWRRSQLQPAPEPATPQVATGMQSFVYRCGTCHAVRGTLAGGSVAPDLTHLMSREIIAGGVVPNTLGNLAGWIVDPQSMKPGTRMPVLDLSGPELQSILAYVETLR